MQQIEIYLKKFQNLGLEEKQLQQKICDVIHGVAGVTLSLDDIKIGKGVVYVNVSGPARAEFVMHKEAIKTKLDSLLDIA